MKNKYLIFIPLLFYNSLISQEKWQETFFPVSEEPYKVELTGDNIDESVLIGKKEIIIYYDSSKVRKFPVLDDVSGKIEGVLIKQNPESGLNEILVKIRMIDEVSAIGWDKKRNGFHLLPYNMGEHIIDSLETKED